MAAQRARACSVAAARPASNGPVRTPSSVMIPVMSSAGVTSNAGFRTSVSGGAMRTPRNVRTSSAARSSIRMSAPLGGRQVDRAGRSADVERHPVPCRQDRQRVRADLVGGVAVGRHPIGADQDDVHLATRHQVPGGHIGEQRVRDAGLGQLPGRQAGSLEIRTGLVDPDVDRTVRVVSGLDDAERGPVLAARQWPGVAVGQDLDGAILERRQDLEPEARQPAMIGRRLEDDRVCLGPHRIGDRVTVLGQVADLLVARHHALDGPAQVDGRRAGVDQGVGGATERRPAGIRPAVALVLGAQRQPDRRDLPDGRRPAHDHLSDGVGDLAGVPARVLLEDVGKAPLVDQVERATVLAERRPETRRPARRRRASRPGRRRPGRAGPPLRPGSGSSRPPGPTPAGAPGPHRQRSPQSGSAHRRRPGRSAAGRCRPRARRRTDRPRVRWPVSPPRRASAHSARRGQGRRLGALLAGRIGQSLRASWRIRVST